jgi:acetate kinase
MSEAIIVLNAGSSSLKFSIYGITDQELDLAAKGQIEGLGTSPHFVAKDQQGRSLVDASLDGSTGSFGHPDGFAHLSQWARAHFGGKLSPIAVGHRVVHGGMKFTAPTLIDEEVIAELERLIPLVPLHQPHNLAGIRAVTGLRPDLPQVGSTSGSTRLPTSREAHASRSKGTLPRFG